MIETNFGCKCTCSVFLLLFNKRSLSPSLSVANIDCKYWLVNFECVQVTKVHGTGELN